MEYGGHFFKTAVEQDQCKQGPAHPCYNVNGKWVHNFAHKRDSACLSTMPYSIQGRPESKAPHIKFSELNYADR
jgi:hypothetical protein